VLSFTIDKETSSAIIDLKDRLSFISRERIREELLKLVAGDGMKEILLEFSPVITQIIPELSPSVGYDQNNPHHEHELYKHLVLTASNIENDPILRLTALLHDVGKPSCRSTDESGISHYYSHAEKSAEIANGIAKSLRCSNSEIDRITSLIKFHDGVIDETDKAIKRRLSQLGQEYLFDLLDLQRADNLAQKTELPLKRLIHNDNLRAIANKIISENACVKKDALAVNGNQLISLGFKGRKIGKALSLLLDAVINGEVENEEKALLDFIIDKQAEIL
jgi:tRNA nucleotidyltransferase (CCA-adding enzyme)